MDFIAQLVYLASVIGILVIAIIIWDTLTAATARKRPLPPGPPSWPLIGCIPTLVYLTLVKKMDRNTMVQYLTKTYGDVISINILGQVTIILGTHGAIKEAFRDPCLSDKTIIKTKTWIHLDTAKIHRKTIMGALKGNNGFNLDSLEEVFREECQRLSVTIKSRVGTTFNVAILLRNATANTGLAFTTGHRFDWNDEKFLNLLDTINENNQKTMQSAASLFLPKSLQYLFPMQDANLMGLINASIESLIAGHSSTGKGISDLVEVYRHQSQLSSEPIFDDDLMRDGVGFLVKAGVHTSAFIISRVAIYFAMLPEIQERVYQEIIKVVGTDRLPQWSDRHQLHYTQAAIMELMRRTRNFVSTFHTAGDETTLRGFTVPKGAILIDLSCNVCDDPELWPNPEECKPERFLDENGRYRERMEFFPFGIGRRSCAGEGLARMQLFLLLTTLLQRYEIRLPSGNIAPHDYREEIFDVSYAAELEVTLREN